MMQQYINGQWTGGAAVETIEVVDPATELIIGGIPRGVAADVHAAVQAAQAAFPGWRQTPAFERAALLHEVANQLKARAEAGLRVYVRTASGPQLDRRLDLGGVDLSLLHKAVQKALQRMPSDPPMPTVHTYPITVAEQIENVRNYIRDAQRLMRAQLSERPTAPVSFTELLSQSATRMEVIVTFLAILELIKQRELLAEQDSTFGEIVLMPVGAGGGDGDIPRE